jgi:integrase
LDALLNTPHRSSCSAATTSPRELRHSFVSVLSDAGVPLEEISRLVGHSGTTVTKLVYRHQLKLVLQTGATVMDQRFKPWTDRHEPPPLSRG